MSDRDLSSIFEQINNLKKPVSDSGEKKIDNAKNTLNEVMDNLSREIRRVLRESNLSQEELCQITNMSQSNISKIQNGKVIPRIDTLQKIAMATSTRLVISFEHFEGDE